MRGEEAVPSDPTDRATCDGRARDTGPDASLADADDEETLILSPRSVLPPRRQRGRPRGSKPRPPALAIEEILTWADAHRDRTGEWPKATSGVIPESPREK